MRVDALRTHALSLAAKGLVPQPLAPNHLRTAGGQSVANFRDEADAAFFVAVVAHLAAKADPPPVPADPQREEIETREQLGE